MRLALNGMGVQPFQLIRDRLLRLELNVLVDRHPNIVALNRRDHLLHLLRHVLRIDRDDLIAVLAAQLALVLALQTIKADVFVILVHEARLRIRLLHRVQNILVDVQAVGVLEELHIADRLGGYRILVIMPLVLLHHFQTRILAPVLHEVGDFLCRQAHLDTPWRITIVLPEAQIKGILNLLNCQLLFTGVS
ncbi:hypothetical protein D3C71_1253630 [compost metagenome]